MICILTIFGDIPKMTKNQIARKAKFFDKISILSILAPSIMVGSGQNFQKLKINTKSLI